MHLNRSQTGFVLGLGAEGQRLLGYLWSLLRYNGAQSSVVLATQAFLTLLLPLTPMRGAVLYAGVTIEDLQGSQVANCQDHKGFSEWPTSSTVLSLPVLMPCIEPFLFCCVSFNAECSSVHSAINTGVTQIVDTQVTLMK